jgi:hypothetical protein
LIAKAAVEIPPDLPPHDAAVTMTHIGSRHESDSANFW